jgi:hypothetical protein
MSNPVDPYRFAVAGGLTSRYFRLYVTMIRDGATWGSSDPGILNLRFGLAATPGGPNLCNDGGVTGTPRPGMTVTESSSYLGLDGMHGVFDPRGTGGSYWHTALAQAFPWWVAIDFGSPVHVEELYVQAVNCCATDRTPFKFFLQTSTDGATWTNVLAVNGQTGWVLETPRVWPIGPAIPSFVSLLHFNEPNGTIVPVDVTGKVWTRAGTTTVVSNAQSKYGGTSLFVGNTNGAGTTNGINTPAHGDFGFGRDNFGIEWWQYNNTINNYQVPISYGGVSAHGLHLQTGNSDGKIQVYVGGSVALAESVAAATGVQDHIALVKDNNVLRLYRAGVQVASAAHSTDIGLNAAFVIGAYASGAYALDGYVDDFRVVNNGMCPYPNGTAFTPPAQHPDI